MASTFMAIPTAVATQQTRPRALPKALDPCHHFPLSDRCRGAIKAFLNPDFRARGRRSPWRTTFFAVAEPVVLQRRRPRAQPEALDPFNKSVSLDWCRGATKAFLKPTIRV